MANDLCDGIVAVTNDAPAIFPLGDTVVTFTAVDSSGNAAMGTTTVTVVDGAAIIGNCIGLVEALIANGTLNQGNGNSLISKLEAATRSLESGNEIAAMNQLLAFVNQVNGFIAAQRLTPQQGQPLIDCAIAAIDQILAGG